MSPAPLQEEKKKMERRAVLFTHRPPSKKASIAWLVMIICTIGAALLAVMVAAQGASAQEDPDPSAGWFQRCTKVFPKDPAANSVGAYFDPIVFPGKAPPVGHRHLFVGATAIGNFYTTDDPEKGPLPLYQDSLDPNTHELVLNDVSKFHRYSTSKELQAGGSTCAFQAGSNAAKVFADSADGVIGGNYSSYWAPDLKVRNGNWAGVIQVNAYYKKGASSVDRQTIKRFPEGLKMVIRDDNTSKTNVKWYCAGLNNGSNGIYRERPYDCNTTAETSGGHPWVTTRITFPQCGTTDASGKVLTDSPNHISHMVYAGDNGCPKDHPQVFPRLILTVKYATSLGANSQLATYEGDDPTLKEDPSHADPGTGFHADYFEAWEPDAVKKADGTTADSLQYFVDHCIKAGINCRDGDMLPPQ
jgi:hypothetical protein